MQKWEKFPPSFSGRNLATPISVSLKHYATTSTVVNTGQHTAYNCLVAIQWIQQLLCSQLVPISFEEGFEQSLNYTHIYGLLASAAA